MLLIFVSCSDVNSNSLEQVRLDRENREALAEAEEIGCTGTHIYEKDGNTTYLPCSTHKEYEQISAELQRQRDKNGKETGMYLTDAEREEQDRLEATTSTISVIEKRKEECRKWKERTVQGLTGISYQLTSFYSAVGRGELSSSWFETYRYPDASAFYSYQLQLNEKYGAGMSEKVKNDVIQAALWYIEGFDKWERGFLEDNLTLFNEGTYAIDMAEKWLQPYMVPSDLKTTQYSFPECRI